MIVVEAQVLPVEVEAEKGITNMKGMAAAAAVDATIIGSMNVKGPTQNEEIEAAVVAQGVRHQKDTLTMIEKGIQEIEMMSYMLQRL